MNYQIADLSSFEKYYAGSRAEDIQVGQRMRKCGQVPKVRVFCRGVEASFPKEILYFLSWKTQFAAQ